MGDQRCEECGDEDENGEETIEWRFGATFEDVGGGLRGEEGEDGDGVHYESCLFVGEY